MGKKRDVGIEEAAVIMKCTEAYVYRLLQEDRLVGARRGRNGWRIPYPIRRRPPRPKKEKVYT